MKIQLFQGAFSGFTVQDTIHFFEELGIEPKEEEFGKVFPMSEQASSILDVLLYELNEIGVQIICDASVNSIARKNGKFLLKLENGQTFQADAVILATGGKAMPSTGSDGSSYALATKLGHTMTEIFPALVQIMLEGAFFKRIDGVKIVGTAEIIYNHKSVAKDSGDILFANYGVSGPPIFQISRKASELLNAGKEAYLKVVLLKHPEKS